MLHKIAKTEQKYDHTGGEKQKRSKNILHKYKRKIEAECLLVMKMNETQNYYGTEETYRAKVNV